jgi:hypothetical protein
MAFRVSTASGSERRILNKSVLETALVTARGTDRQVSATDSASPQVVSLADRFCEEILAGTAQHKPVVYNAQDLPGKLEKVFPASNHRAQAVI